MTSDVALAQLSDLNYVEAYRELSRRAGGVVLDEDGLTCWVGAHPLPVLANGVARIDHRVGPARVLERARAFFGAHRRGFSVILQGERDADLRPVCEAAGLVQMGDSPGMALDHRLGDAVPPSGVDVRRVETIEDAVAFGRVNGEAYATYGMPPGCAEALLGRLEVLLAPHIVGVVARVDGAPAAAAMVILTHGIGGVYWVGTTPAARGKGLAELCTRAVGNVAFDMGARVVVLQASVMGEPIYRRMGYVEVTRYPYYVQLTPPER
ncbi:MAG: GNAT family N-acetyltransferase [Candidatus Binatia bacterium]